MARVLISYLIPHSGHHAAALAVESALRRTAPSVETMVVDPLQYTRPYWSAIIEKTYMIVLRRTPEVWDALYDNEKIDHLTRRIRRLVQRGSSRRFLRMMKEFNPDLVICTQAYPFGVMSAYKRKFGAPLPLFGVITDYWPHRFWVHEGDGQYFLPTPQAAARLAALGVKRSRMIVSGIPIGPEFAPVADGPDPVLPARRILVMGGSRGLGVRYRTIRSLDRSAQDFAIEVVTGKNRQLANRLLARRRRFKHPIRVRGYVKSVAPLMRSSALLLGKPGGMTSAEAMAVGLPLIIIRPLPGQEVRNMNQLTVQGAAVHLDRDRHVAPAVDMLLGNEELLAMMRQRALQLGRPDAAPQIAQEVLRHL
ncbi:MAG: hypothetical protein JXR37_35690 [Kiritimatiellae bacterium]|nr:hypothetical protein [Kiritimatiellia bacterium]